MTKATPETHPAQGARGGARSQHGGGRTGLLGTGPNSTGKCVLINVDFNRWMERGLNKGMSPWTPWKWRTEGTLGGAFPKEYLSPVRPPKKVTLGLSQGAGLRPSGIEQGK